ncbi:hypothetical protein DXG03_002476 [Asterophora parasitica]|uniref:C3H1-type domain-containing protein n=1 Tax=Asterophora parasitica TaxID=117018 RepID=A0A9P7G2Y4_9AGAR|nr:hypothetical protein DXG03_002476 [Asterophora parasitica]
MYASVNDSVGYGEPGESPDATCDTLSSTTDQVVHALKDDSPLKSAPELERPAKDPQNEDQSEVFVYLGEVPMFQDDDDSSNVHCRTSSIDVDFGRENDKHSQEKMTSDLFDPLAPLPIVANRSSWAEDVAATQKPWAPERKENSDILPHTSSPPKMAELDLLYPSSLYTPTRSLVDSLNPEISNPVTPDEAGFYAAPLDACNSHIDPLSQNLIDPSNPAFLQPVTLNEVGIYIPDAASADAYDVHPFSHDDQRPDTAPLMVLHWSEYADPNANTMVPFCKFFAQARCEQGAACRFRHSLAVKEYAMLFRDPQPPLWSPNGHINRDESTNPAASSIGVCKFYPLGKCRNGTSCPYLHTPSGDAQSIPAHPDSNNEQFESTLHPSEPRIQPCKYFMEFGRCRKFDQCHYSHDITSHQGPSEHSSGGGAMWKTSYDLCKYYLQGTCQFGIKCRFSHESAPAEEAGVESNVLPQDAPSRDKDDGWGTDAEGWGVDEWAKPRGWGDKELPVEVEEPEPHRGNEESSLYSDRRWPPHESEYAPWAAPKTTPCIYHFRGRGCKKGDRCNFDHNGPHGPQSGALRSAGSSNATPSRSSALGTPARSASPRGAASGEDNFSRTWGAAEGTNQEAEAHDGGWGDSESENELSPWTAPKEPLCHFYVQGRCKKGSLCQLRHENPESPEAPLLVSNETTDELESRKSEAEGITKRMDDVDEPQQAADDMGDFARPDSSENAELGHDEDEKTWEAVWVNPSDESFPPFKSRAPCKAFGQGYCPHQDSCRYAHVVDVDAMVELPARHLSPTKVSQISLE